jgi:predicted NUDIX family NTP pyrophosphohydrolase
VDKGEWFSIADAREKILSGQQALLERLLARLSDSKRSGPRVSPSSETNL